MWEGIMLVCFGASWPTAIVKTLKVKNPKGKSFLFMSLILIGYVSGIIGKAVSLKGACLSNIVFWLYVLNFFMVATDYCLCLYYTVQRKKLGLD
ncbi:MAG: hypothetical protein E7051_03745 [Lentisphaerae bacterium]|nr:hypothetical protein [Lentisphaerota bacterium]